MNAPDGPRRRWSPRLTARTPSTGSADPASDRAAALAKLAELMALDEQLPESTRSRLLQPDAPTPVTLVIWHGFTNAPAQFLPVAEQLRQAAYRVLLPRIPHHGLADLLNRDLLNLTVDELVAHVDACVDIAAGLGEEVWVAGLSAGGTLAAWAASTRPEVSRAVLLAPLVAPHGFPAPAVRLCVRFPRIVPRYYRWWDAKAKADLGHSPHAYPGFPLPGVVPFLRLSEALADGRVRVGHRLQRVVLVSNVNDDAVRQDAAAAFASSVFGAATDRYGQAHIAAALRWTHDFVDPWSPAGGSAEQVTAVLRAGLGTGDPAAGGVLEPPLVDEQP